MSWFKKIKEDKEQALKTYCEKISKNKEIVEKIIEKYFGQNPTGLKDTVFLCPVKQFAHEKNKKYQMYQMEVYYVYDTNIVLSLHNHNNTLETMWFDVDDLPNDIDDIIKKVKDDFLAGDKFLFDPYKEGFINGKKILSIDNDIVTVEE